MAQSKEEKNAKDRERYRRQVLTAQGRADHAAKTRSWRANTRPEGWQPTNKPTNYWTKERCLESAVRYNTRSDFQVNEATPYYTCVRKGWLDDVCGHMLAPMASTIFWTKEACADEASKHGTRTALIKCKPGAYNAALKHGWLDDVCRHMKPKWTYELVAGAAQRHKTRAAFKAHDNDAYIIARRRGWIDAVCAHMGPPEKLKVFTRQVYIIRERGAPRVYVGLSVNPIKRYADHKSYGVPAVKELIAGDHRFLVLTRAISSEQAADLERRLIERFRSRGWAVVNSRKAGGLGSAPLRWTDSAIRSEAQKYMTRGAFMRQSASAYMRAIQIGMLDSVCEHMTSRKKPDGYWTRERVLAQLALAKSRREASEGENNVAYNMAIKYRILQEALAHLPKNAGWSSKRAKPNNVVAAGGGSTV